MQPTKELQSDNAADPIIVPTVEPTIVVPEAATPAPSTPAAMPEVTVGQMITSGAPLPPGPTNKKRKLWIFAGAGLAVLLIASGVVFGWYLPNTPDHVYDTAIKRSGQAVNGLVQLATDKQQVAAFEASKLSGSADVTVDKSHYSGTFSSSFDKTISNESVDVTLKDAAGKQQVIGLKGMSRIASGSMYPDIYFQLTGIKDLGLDELLPNASSYDGKWIFVSSSYLQSLGDQVVKTDTTAKSQLTADEAATALRTVSTISQQYLFSTASDKAVLEKRRFVGKETVDGLSAYHYAVGVNIAHAKAYCQALSSALLATPAYQKVAGHAATAPEKTKAAKSCQTADYSDLQGTYDMWVDGHYKLMYKVRVYDKTDHASYVDVGQRYQGGDKLALFVRVHDAVHEADGSVSFDTDLKTKRSTGRLTATGTDSQQPFTVKVTVQIEPATTAPKFSVPASSSKLEDILHSPASLPTGQNQTVSQPTDSQPASGTDDTSGSSGSIDELPDSGVGTFPAGSGEPIE